MKKYIIVILLALGMLPMQSCLEEYLNQAPESGLNEEEVFSKYENFKSFFDDVYEGRKYFSGGWRDYNIKTAHALYFGFWDQKYTWEGVTDAADQGRFMEGQTFKSGQVSAFVNKFTYDGKRRPILESMFTDIRICNMAIRNIDKLQDVNEKDKADFLGQAHFIRAYCHMTLVRLWGPMPYLTTVIGPDDEWDIPRLSKYDSFAKIAMDMDSAATYFQQAEVMRRDAGPGEPGHLNDPNQHRPNGVAAKAFKARALLYAASPLNNDKGQKAWEDAAKAGWEAIQVALQYKYELLSLADYKKNYIGNQYSNEQLWGWYAGTKARNNGDLAGLMNGVFGSSKSSYSGVCPTQNFVDKFETKYGEALNTEEDRTAAEAAGHYKEQDPYKDRDPRFYIDIIYNQAPIPGYTKANIYYQTVNGVQTYGDLLDQAYLGITRTGYYLRKTWGEQSVKNKTKPMYTDPLIRLGELYLDYAEAANEAYGPNTPAPGASMNAVQATNVIRTRAGMPDVLSQYTGSKEMMRDRIKNERNIELCYEGHYYHDIRRWKDAPVSMSGPLMGVDIEKVAVTAEYPTGFRYSRYPISADRQSRWKDAMYYLPFNTEDNYKMKNFVPNVVW